jgi:hypothetical protein
MFSTLLACSSSLTTLERSHHFTMSELDRHKDELRVS